MRYADPPQLLRWWHGQDLIPRRHHLALERWACALESIPPPPQPGITLPAAVQQALTGLTISWSSAASPLAHKRRTVGSAPFFRRLAAAGTRRTHRSADTTGGARVLRQSARARHLSAYHCTNTLRSKVV